MLTVVTDLHIQGRTPVDQVRVRRPSREGEVPTVDQIDT